jgi:hypothetical protein
MANWTLWLLLGLTVASMLSLAIVWHMQRSIARERAIQRFLDAADGLERDLQDCKKRMQAMQERVSRIPGDRTREVSSVLNADTAVGAALKLVLSRRLWLRDHHESASINELRAAEENLSNSRTSLAENMSKLETMREELERATELLESRAATAKSEVQPQPRAQPVREDIAIVSAVSNHTIH